MTFDLGGRAASATTAELRTAAALRWQRPLLTAELAEQSCARAVADGDDLRWVQAAGWLLDGHAAGGDARDVATAVIAGMSGQVTPGAEPIPVPARTPGTEVLTRPEGARLRVELAGVAQADGELDAARALVLGLPDDAPGEDPGLLRLDRLAVEVRCALAGASAVELERLRSDVEACGAGFGGEPAAYADLVVGSVHRARREHEAAVDRALRGLAQLGWTPERPGARPLSAHLAVALLSQWITALLDSGRVPADAVAAAAVQRDAGDAGRQGVLLRLTLARVQAGRADHAARALVEAADGAEHAGVPALVAACRTAQSELYEGSGRYREALEAMRAAMDADQVDRDRGTRFRAAVATLLPLAAVRVAGRPTPFPRSGGAAAAREPDGDGTPGAGNRRTASTGGTRSPGARAHRSVARGIEDGRRPGSLTGSDRSTEGGRSNNGPAGDGSAGDGSADHGSADGVASDSGSADRGSANDLFGVGGFPVRWTPPDSLLHGPGTNGAPAGGPPSDVRTTDPSELVHRNGHHPGDPGTAPDPTGVPGTSGAPGATGGPEADGSADRSSDARVSGRERAAGIDPADPLGVSGLVPGGETAATTPRDPSCTGPSWTPDIAGGSPLADALLAEWRTPEQPPPVEDISSPRPADATPKNGVRRVAAHRSGDRPGAIPTARPGSPGTTGGAPDGVAGPDAVDVPDRPAAAPSPAEETGNGPVAAPLAQTPPTGPPGPTERSIVVDLVDADLEAVTGTAAVGALHDVATRARRLVPPPGTTRRDQDTVRVTLPHVDHVTVLLWARSLATHLGGRVRRGGLPAGTSLRMQAVGPHGVEGEEIVTELTGPDTVPPLPDTSAEQTGDGPVPPVAEPVAGPALATPLDLSDGRAARGGRRRTTGDATSSLSAVGITVRPGSGGRRRSEGTPRNSTTPDTVVPGPGARDPGAHGSSAQVAATRDAATRDTVVPGPGSQDPEPHASTPRAAADRDRSGPAPSGPVPPGLDAVQAGNDPAPVGHASEPDPLDTRFALPAEPDRRLADAVRAHLDLPGPDGDASRQDGPSRERAGLPVRWSEVDAAAEESALPRRRGRGAGPSSDHLRAVPGGWPAVEGTAPAPAGEDVGAPGRAEGDSVAAATWTVRTGPEPATAPALSAPGPDDGPTNGSGAAHAAPADVTTAPTRPDVTAGAPAEARPPATRRDPADRTVPSPAPTAAAGPAAADVSASGPAPEPGADGSTLGGRGSEQPVPGTPPVGDAAVEQPTAGEDAAGRTTVGNAAAAQPGTVSSPADGAPEDPDDPPPSDPAGIPADMGLADLLAGALAAYREI
ncbi:hypothetical protein [Pseudonocardia sp. ICBG1293]|uniref:hypothetical protein n=1 Tax=Pseudonocardia sp. ICBG1293 TaxID=2844382 RepID=UPI001CCA0422|nr:hypothetical protein [Pseudonocardia sp. ICBG1293]